MLIAMASATDTQINQRQNANASPVLIIGYGNVDRQDDGVAWHVLSGIAQRFGGQTPASLDDEFESADPNVDLLFMLQLMPELAETIARYERVCFVDAHTGAVPHDVNVEELSSEFQSSPFTHHMTASTLLSFAETLYHHAPQAILVSVRGYEFGFARSLSPRTAELAEEAADLIEKWLKPA